MPKHAGETDLLNSPSVPAAAPRQSLTTPIPTNVQPTYNVSTSSGGPANVQVKMSNAINPDVITISCPVSAQLQTSRLLYVTTADGEELEVPIPDGVETEDEFDVDMGDVSDDEAEEDA